MIHFLFLFSFFKEIPGNEKNLCFAITELSGHFILPLDADYDTVDEEFIIQVAKNIQQDEKKVQEIKQKIFELK